MPTSFFAFWQVVAQTPWWIALVIALLIWRGLIATRAQQVPALTPLILSVFFLICSLSGLFFLVPLTPPHLFICLGSALFGIGMGWLQSYLRKIKAVAETRQLHIPGSIGLLLWLSVIGFLYISGLTPYLHLSELWQTNTASLLAALFGLSLGMAIGRAVYILRCLKTGPFYTLTPIRPAAH